MSQNTAKGVTIGQYSSWMVGSDAEGHAVGVPADDILDAMLEGATMQEAQEMADEKARTS